MAETIKGIQVNIEGNTKSLGSALSDVNKDIKATQSNLKKVEDALKLNPENVTLLEQKEKLLAQQTEQVSQKLETLKSVQSQVEEQFKNGDIGIDAYADFTKQLGKTQEQYDSLGKSAEDVCEDLTKPLDKAQEQYDTLGKTTENVSKNVDKASSSVKENTSVTEDNTNKQKDNSKVAETLKNALQGVADVSFKALTSSIEGIGSAIKGISTVGLEAITTTVEASTKAFETYTTAITGSITAIGGFALSIGEDFSAQMSTVQSLAGYTDGSDESIANMEALEEKAKELGATTSFTATQVGEAFEYMAMAGWGSDGTDKMLAGIEPIVNLTSATGADLGTVSDIVTDAMSSFGMEINTENVEHFADVLAKTTTSSNTDIEQLGEAFKNVAPMANSLGYSVDEVSTALGVMANSGIKGSTAGNALKTSLSRLASPTESMTEVMNRLGISLSDENGNTLGFSDMLDQLRSKLKGVSAELVDAEGNLKDYDELEEELSGNNEQLQLISDASTLFGKNQVASMLTLINATDDEYASLEASIENCSGAAEAMADVKLDNLSGDLTILESATQGVGLAVYDYIESPIREVVQSVTELMSGLNAGIETGLDWTGMMDNITAFREDLVEKFETAFPEILNAYTGYEMVFNSAIENILSGAIDIFPQVVGQMLPVAVMSFWNLVNDIIDQVTESAPTLVASASNLIIAFCNGLTSASNNIQESTPELLDALLNGITKITPTVLNMGGSILTTIANGIVTGAGKIKPLISPALESISTFFKENTSEFLESGVEIVESLVTGIGNDSETLATTVSQIIGDVVNVFTSNLNTFASIGESLIDGLLTGFSNGDLLGSAVTLITGLVQSINDNITYITDVAEYLILTLADGIIEALPSLLQSSLEIVLKIATAITDFLPELVPVAISILDTLTGFIVDNLDLLVDGAVKICTNLADFIVGNLPTLIECGFEIITQLLDAISQNTDTLVDGAIEIIETLASYMIDNFPMLMDMSTQMIEKIVFFIGECAGDLLEGAVKIITELVKYLCDPDNQDKLKEFSTSIHETLASLISGEEWNDLGKSIMEGILSGIIGYDMSGWMSQSGQEFIDNFVTGWRQILEINSPSKLMAREVGSPIMEGVGYGVQQEMPEVESIATEEVSNLADTIVQSVNFGDITGTVTTNLDNAMQTVSANNTEVQPIDTIVKTVDFGDITGTMTTNLTNTIEQVANFGDALGSITTNLADVSLPDLSSITNLSGYTQTVSNVSNNTNNSYSSSYGSLFSGATININSDDDIESLAEKLYYYIQKQDMGVGVA